MKVQEYSLKELEYIMKQERDNKCSECGNKAIDAYDQKVLILDGTPYISTLYTCKECDHTSQYLFLL